MPKLIKHGFVFLRLKKQNLEVLAMTNESEKDKEIFRILKEKDEKLYKAERQFYDDAHSGDFRDFADFEIKSAEEIVMEILQDLEENFVIVERKIPLTEKAYDYDLENFKRCPLCNKRIDYHIDGFYHDEILNIWICGEHRLEEIKKVIELKDRDLIEFIKAGEKDKGVIFV